MDEDKVRIWVWIVWNYFEVDDLIVVEMFINKFKNIMYDGLDLELILYF